MILTADGQTDGRGRQGRSWYSPIEAGIYLSVILRTHPQLVSFASGLAVATAVGHNAKLKWPNDVLIGSRKLGGVLIETQPQAGWMVVGVGINVNVKKEDVPNSLRTTLASLQLEKFEIDELRLRLISQLNYWLKASETEILNKYRQLEILTGKQISWSDGSGRALEINCAGELIVTTDGNNRIPLRSGEVHLDSYSVD